MTPMALLLCLVIILHSSCGDISSRATRLTKMTLVISDRCPVNVTFSDRFRVLAYMFPNPFYLDDFGNDNFVDPAIYTIGSLFYGEGFRRAIHERYNTMDKFADAFNVQFDTSNFSSFADFPFWSDILKNGLWMCAKNESGWATMLCEGILSTIKIGGDRNHLLLGGEQTTTRYEQFSISLNNMIALIPPGQLLSLAAAVQLDADAYGCISVSIFKEHVENVTQAREYNERNTFEPVIEGNLLQQCFNNNSMTVNGQCNCSATTSGPFCVFPCPNPGKLGKCLKNGDTVMDIQCFNDFCAPFKYPVNATSSQIFVNDDAVDARLIANGNDEPAGFRFEFTHINRICNQPDYDVIVESKFGKPFNFKPMEILYNKWNFCNSPFTFVLPYAQNGLRPYRTYKITLSQNYRTDLDTNRQREIFVREFETPESSAGDIESAVIVIDKSDYSVNVVTAIRSCNGRIVQYSIRFKAKRCTDNKFNGLENSGNFTVDQDCRTQTNVTINLPSNWITSQKGISGFDLEIIASTARGYGTKFTTSFADHSLAMHSCRASWRMPVYVYLIAAVIAVLVVGTIAWRCLSLSVDSWKWLRMHALLEEMQQRNSLCGLCGAQKSENGQLTNTR